MCACISYYLIRLSLVIVLNSCYTMHTKCFEVHISRYLPLQVSTCNDNIRVSLMLSNNANSNYSVVCLACKRTRS
ncbi:hypothetical protein PR003_g11975 [Phytophthora rubi]|uniref:Secreted protein n=1 Tax=Phytophthora rubi TaxID=129364 RepID=A0A6A3MU59_9STRA|nr:hypothetical protein PR002_g9807 [Phytophthora rubi]KAE9034902.1 hypothetical protein PR001_g9539 [Phytophthora rubi]KAE9337498.1 hypothetical protein PR003_g11975 [Phytophthora rubi]